jgi:hypothetical protein
MPDDLTGTLFFKAENGQSIGLSYLPVSMRVGQSMLAECFPAACIHFVCKVFFWLPPQAL